MVNLRFEQVKITVIGKIYSWKSVPLNSCLQKEAVQVELTFC